MREGVYRRGVSPYRRLLAAAGCEYGDLERLVRQEGVDGALLALLRHGVYVTLDEFKGRRPIVRGATSFVADPTQFRNPLSGSHVAFPSGGSRGKATPILFDFSFIRDLSVNTGVVLSSMDGLGWTRACWDVPGSGVMIRVLDLASLGMRLDRWFSYVDPALPGLPRRYRWSFRTMCWGSRMAGRPIPHPVHVAPDDPLPIVRWMTSVLRAGGTPHLLTYATSAVRLSQAALAAGIDLRGARIWVGGEPLTPARAASIRQSGAGAVDAVRHDGVGSHRGRLPGAGGLGRRPRVRGPPRRDPAGCGGAPGGLSRRRRSLSPRSVPRPPCC